MSKRLTMAWSGFDFALLIGSAPIHEIYLSKKRLSVYFYNAVSPKKKNDYL
tara:strand:- start:1221 stop:1373 length:153 start_codon:yes stop_codon:yes gene_type:complete